MNSGSVCPQSGTLNPQPLEFCTMGFQFSQMPHGSMYLHGHPTPGTPDSRSQQLAELVVSNPKKNCGVMEMLPTFGA